MPVTWKLFSNNPERSEENDLTKTFAQLSKHVDRFHIQNHVYPVCQETMNPQGIGNLKGVNTQVCEQLFKELNSHMNCKSFNKSRLFLFFLYNIHLHNLSIENMTIVADPREEFRWSKIVRPPVNLDDDAVDIVTKKMETIQLGKKFEFNCDACGTGYSQEGYLKKHMEVKHAKPSSSSTGGECPMCGSVLATARSFEKHIKSHLTSKPRLMA